MDNTTTSNTSAAAVAVAFRDDTLVVNYQGAVIYGRDLKILEDVEDVDGDGDAAAASATDSWLNDSIIHYFLTRRMHTYSNNNNNNSDHHHDHDETIAAAANNTSGKNDRRCRSSRSRILCLDPSVLTFLMMQQEQVQHDHLEEEEEDDGEKLEWMNDLIDAHPDFFLADDDDDDDSRPTIFLLPINDLHNNHQINHFISGREGGRYNRSQKPGTHWSLLFLVRITETTAHQIHNTTPVNVHHYRHKYYHCDSCSHRVSSSSYININYDNNKSGGIENQKRHDSIDSYNTAAARAVVVQWNALLQHSDNRRRSKGRLRPTGRTTDTDTTCAVASEATTTIGNTITTTFESCHVPRQANGYDCGMHVLASVDALLLASQEHQQHQQLQHQQPQQKDSMDREMPWSSKAWIESSIEKYFMQPHSYSHSHSYSHASTPPAPNPIPPPTIIDVARVCDALRLRIAQDIRFVHSNSKSNINSSNNVH